MNYSFGGGLSWGEDVIGVKIIVCHKKYGSFIKVSTTFFLEAGSSENQVLPISYLLVQESLQRLGKVRACEIIPFFFPWHDI